jgi:hypothetical protein
MHGTAVTIKIKLTQWLCDYVIIRKLLNFECKKTESFFFLIIFLPFNNFC